MRYLVIASLLLISPALGADMVPLPPIKDQTRAIRAPDVKSKLSQKQFERSLQSPIGKGRLE